MYYGTYTCLTELILVLQSLFLYFGSYTELILVQKVPVGTTQIHYTEVPVGTTGLIIILQNLYLYYRYGSTRRYYRTDTEVPVGTFRSLSYSFHSESYHITVGLPRPVIRNE